MRFKNERGRKISKVLIILPLLGAVLLVFGILKFFSAENPTINFTNTPCEKIEVINNKLDLKGKNIFLINLKNVDAEIKKKFLCIESTKIEKKLPASISIYLKSREPILMMNYYKLSSSSGNLSLKDINISSQSSRLNIPDSNLKFEGYFFIDKEGVITSTESAKKTVFTANFIGSRPKISTKMEDFIRRSIQILAEVKKHSFSGTKILIVENKFLIFYGEPDVIFSFNKDPKEQVTSLQLILEQAKMNSNHNNPNNKDSKDISKVDLRYDKPVITFSK